MRAMTRNLSTIGIGIAALGISACSGGGGESLDPTATGELSLAITDAPVDSVESIVVQFTGVRLKPQGGPAIDIPFIDADGDQTTLEVDMLTLTDGTYADLFGEKEVPAGVYNWVELQVLADESNPDDSYVMSNGGKYELRIPSSSENGLRFVSPFTVTADHQTHLLLDWDMRLALTQPPGQGGTYMLRPAFRLIDMTEHGTLAGSVAAHLIDVAGCPADETLGTGNSVYVYLASELDAENPEDIGAAAGPTPVATGVVQLDSGLYAYEVILSPGEYRIAYTCDGEADDVEADDDIDLILSPETIVIVDGATVTIDFS